MRLGLILLVCLCLLSCGNRNKVSKPKNLIPKDKMVDIIVDMSLFNSAKGTNRYILDRNGIEEVSYIYNKYNIDSLQFVESNNYYAHDLETYTKIYTKVQDSLVELKEIFTKKQKQEMKEKAKADSIKRAKISNKKVKIKKEDSLKKQILKPLEAF